MEIEKIINNLVPKKASGPFSIPVTILKSIKHLVSKPLSAIFNSSISSGIFPESFKIASVIPIFKKGSQLDVSNYRPISLLSIFSRIFEKLMHNRIINYVNKNDILFNKQFGFRSRHSTLQAILSITEKIQTAIDQNTFSCGVFLDLSKAFDTVNHKILLDKLDHYGIQGLSKAWFESYLTNRKQFVSLGNVKSDALKISCGVPQGSVLGPLLFLLYINDFHRSSSIFEFHLFADDSNLFYSHKNLRSLETSVNEQLALVHCWLCTNKLSLNVEKSSFIIFHSAQKKLNYDPPIKINNMTLKHDEQIKYLGIMMDTHLTWKPHIAYISQKIKRNIGLISKVRHFVTLDILTKLYYSFVYPFLIYGIVAWGHTYESTISPLFILQKKCLRIMSFAEYNAHTNPIFIKLKILKLADLVLFNTALFMYDYHTNNLPNSFNSFFNPVNQRHSYNTRLASKATYSLPKIRTNYGKFSIRFSGAKIWNKIDESLKKLKREKFKDCMREQIINSYSV